MRIFKYWTRVEGSISVEGRTQRVHAYGGSNNSVQAAAADAERRLDSVRQRIAGETARDAETYEVDIREEVLARIDERNVVTRNRYGAAVLNSAEVLFIDIDAPRLGFLDLFRARPTGARRTAMIVEQVKRLALKAPELRGLGVRLYETHSGVRAIVTGQHFDPKDAATQKLLRRFNADRLYSHLCRRQGCFRARLTPKPWRIGIDQRIRPPVAAWSAEQANLPERLAWIAGYEQRSRGHAACCYLGSLGDTARIDPKAEHVCALHDAMARADSDLPLA